MKTYIYKVITSSTKRGYNRTIEVYRVKNNKPVYLSSNEHINTASYKGDLPTAKQLIAKIEHYKFANYDFKYPDNINVYEV